MEQTRSAPGPAMPSGPDRERVVYLVRHGKAGKRGDGPDDRRRPLTPKGRHQAEALAAWLDGGPTPQVLTSPYTRCVQTVEPLATRAGREITLVDGLAEGNPVGPVLDLLREVPEGSVLCTHGDVLELAIGRLVRDGMRVRGAERWEKGAVWVLARSGGDIATGWSLVLPDGTEAAAP